jgi:signal transduction histidine kinase
LPQVLTSLQSKLIVSFCLVVLVALVLAAAVFVYIRRGDQREQELDRVVAASPAIYGTFSILQERKASEEVMLQFVNQAAQGFEARILFVDRRDGTVLADSGDELTGKVIEVPQDLTIETRPANLTKPYFSWEPSDGQTGEGLILVSEVPSGPLHRIAPRAEEFWLFLAVPQSSIRDAWQGLLPGLILAALIAVPVAVALAVALSRYITRPLAQLTAASQQLAEGRFDVRVNVDRSDEVGRLAQAFSTMAHRVGDAHSQMRALVANVSHDLKTPLTSILGFGQALRDGGAKDDAEARRMGTVIYDEAQRMTTRLNDLLYLSELESGQTMLERDEIDLRRLLQQTVDRIEPAAAARGVDVQAQLSEALVNADGPKLERAVENLLENARKYAPSGGEIVVRNSNGAGGARIEIANTAPDLSEDELPRLFERFYRRDRSRGANGGGSGLGLPIARDLIELHGGTLDAALRNGDLVLTISLPASA